MSDIPYANKSLTTSGGSCTSHPRLLHSSPPLSKSTVISRIWTYPRPRFRIPLATIEATKAQPTTKDPGRTKVTAIGPFTDAFLLDNFGICVHAMAQKASPEEILAVVEAEDRRITGG